MIIFKNPFGRHLTGYHLSPCIFCCPQQSGAWSCEDPSRHAVHCIDYCVKALRMLFFWIQLMCRNPKPLSTTLFSCYLETGFHAKLIFCCRHLTISIIMFHVKKRRIVFQLPIVISTKFLLTDNTRWDKARCSVTGFRLIWTSLSHCNKAWHWYEDSPPWVHMVRHWIYCHTYQCALFSLLQQNLSRQVLAQIISIAIKVLCIDALWIVVFFSWKATWLFKSMSNISCIH